MIYSVFSILVFLNTYSNSRNLERVAVSKLVELIKHSRKSCANGYRKRVKMASEEAALALNDISIVVSKTGMENDLITALDRSIIVLEKVVISFNAKNRKYRVSSVITPIELNHF